MEIPIICNPAETAWQRVRVDEWVQRTDTLTFNLSNWSPSRVFDRFDFRIRFRSGKAELYRYFPFSFKVTGNAPQAEIGEIGGADQNAELTLMYVAPTWRSQITLSFISEQAGIPITLGLGPDERDLALIVEEVHFRQRKAGDDAVRIVQNSADTDLEDQSREIAPIFVVGSGRCGSSNLTWALGQHPNIVPMEETLWLPMTLYGAAAGFRMASGTKLNAPDEYQLSSDQFLQHIGGAIHNVHTSISRSIARADFLKRLSGRADGFDPSFQRMRTNWSPKRRWVDGTPLNTGLMPLLARVYPRAQFVGIVRDPRGVIASYHGLNAVGGVAHSVEEAAIIWIRAARMLLQMQDALGSQRIMIANYHEFSEPEVLIRRTLRFLGEANCTSCVKPVHTRTNSSNVSDEIRASVNGPIVDKCTELYAGICEGVPWKALDWGESASESFDDWLNDLLSRLIRQIS